MYKRQIPEGDGIHLLVTQTGEDYIPSPVSTMAVTLGLGTSSILTLPISETDCDELFLPPMQEPYPQCLITTQ